MSVYVKNTTFITKLNLIFFRNLPFALFISTCFTKLCGTFPNQADPSFFTTLLQVLDFIYWYLTTDRYNYVLAAVLHVQLETVWHNLQCLLLWILNQSRTTSRLCTWTTPFNYLCALPWSKVCQDINQLPLLVNYLCDIKAGMLTFIFTLNRNKTELWLQLQKYDLRSLEISFCIN